MRELAFNIAPVALEKTDKTSVGERVRRMDPQPDGGAISWRPGYQSLVTGSAGYRIGKQLFQAPADMPTAKPWRDRDGEWYWRQNLRA